MPEGPERTCPSATCAPGNVLLGVVTADGKVGYMTPAMRIDEEFVAKARAGRAPERRFRFAGTCVEAGCAQWRNGRCGVIDSVMQQAEPAASEGLPQCSIRSSCRWFAQAGRDACAVCPLVVTETG